MIPSKILRLSLLAGALAASLSAQAVTIGLSSVGTFDNSNAPTLQTNERVVAQQGGYGVLTSLQLNYTGGPLPESGTGFYTGTGGTLKFSFTYSDSVFGTGTQLLSGTWTAAGGTGTYSGATGDGTIGTNFDISGSGPTYPTFTVFRGTIAAVPEPASLGAMAIGGAALLRRRKRA